MTGAPAFNFQPVDNLREPPSLHSRSQLTLFCDFDGPIIDVSDRYYNTYQFGLESTQALYQNHYGVTLPIQVLSKEQFWNLKRDHVSDCEIATRSGLRLEQIQFFLGRVRQLVNQSELLQQDHLQPYASWTLHRLHRCGVRLALVTLRCQRQATQILESHGLAHLFGRICGTTDEHAAYQNYASLKAELLQNLLSDGFYDPTQGSAWMVGDTEADILAGQAVGIPTIALTCGIRSRFYLKKFNPTHVYSDLRTTSCHLLECSQLAQV
ncbi:MAG: HAD family hydrolase [Scytolyngbya sp. HA4215-MV1]|jgi:phosphoglycolate phosphatase-like HAD superfamily hydrolase|nr:HAD family hydrolase [Scytolyngbya sp. HA4215-MV1]